MFEKIWELQSQLQCYPKEKVKEIEKYKNSKEPWINIECSKKDFAEEV